MEFPAKDPNLCDLVMPACPLKKGSAYTFTLKDQVPHDIPEFEAEVRYLAKGDEGELYCVKFDMKFV